MATKDTVWKTFPVKWNDTIPGHKISTENLKTPSLNFVTDCLCCLLPLMGVDVEKIMMPPTTANPSADTEVIDHIRPLISMTNVVNQILSGIAPDQFMSVYDIVSPDPKRTLLILRTLHNFAVYCMMTTKNIDEKVEEQKVLALKTKEAKTELEKLVGDQIMEKAVLEQSIQKMMKKLPSSEDGAELQAEIKVATQDLQRAKLKLQDHQDTLARTAAALFKARDDLEHAQMLVVSNGENILNNLKNQEELLKESEQELEGLKIKVIQATEDIKLQEKAIVHISRLIQKLDYNTECLSEISELGSPDDALAAEQKLQTEYNNEVSRKMRLEGSFQELLDQREKDAKIQETAIGQIINEKYQRDLILQKKQQTNDVTKEHIILKETKHFKIKEENFTITKVKETLDQSVREFLGKIEENAAIIEKKVEELCSGLPFLEEDEKEE